MRSRFTSKASSFFVGSTSIVRSVGMPISVGITASVPYVSENGVSPLFDFIVVRWDHRTCESSSIQSLLLSSNLLFIPSPKLLFALSTKPFVCGAYGCNQHDGYIVFHTSLNGLSRNCFPLSDTISPGVIHVLPSFSTTERISFSFMDFSFSYSTSTYLLRCAKLMDAILLRASAFLFSLRGTCLMENSLKLLMSVFTLFKYWIMPDSLAT
ncbi:hypothetical protein Tco_1292518 [Tanacetum coccineum]